LSSSAAANVYPASDDYRLRIYQRYQPQFAMMFGITAHDHDARNEAEEKAIGEDDDFPHHLERYLFQFWPVPSTREILLDETALETHPNPRLSPLRVKAGQSIFSIRW
jgi:predicted amino acid dehydrogenase